jgi:NhaP-type Na+/H+ or K+/H+ antiporter
MIIIGLLVGPFFNIVDQSELANYTPLVVTLTLIIVLLDSGLSLEIADIARSFAKAAFFTILVLVITTSVVGGFLYLIGWNPLHALLLGVVSSGTTTIVVTSLLIRLSIPREIKQILILESIINDVTLVTAAVIIILAIVEPIAISVVVGIFFMIVWVNAIEWFYHGEELVYCFTLGVLFLMYSVVELIEGNGAIAILVLSLSLGNLPEIINKIGRSRLFSRYPPTLKRMADRSEHVVDEIKKTQLDFSFFIKIFFFVYLGVIFDLSALTPFLVAICVIILALMFVSRYVSSRILALSDSNFKRYASIISAMVARGFTATFVALLPSTMGIEIPLLKELILMMVLFSTLPTIAASIIFERKARTEPSI